LLAASSWVFVLAVVLLAGVELVAVLKLRIRYLDERGALEMTRSNLTAAIDAASSAPAIGEAAASDIPVTIDPEVVAQGVRPGTIVAARLDLLAKLGRSRVRIAAESLRRLSHEQAAALPEAGFVRFASQMLLLLGVFGTLLSLPGNGDLAARIRFAPLLFGCFLGMAGFSADHLLRWQHASFFAAFERFTVEDLLPATAPDRDDESLLQQVSLQLEESSVQLAGVIEQNRDAIEELTGAQTAFAAMLEQVRSLVVSDARQDLSRVIEQLDRATRGVLGVVEGLPALTAAIEATSHSFQQRFDSLMRRWFFTAAGIGLLLLWMACAAHG